MRNMQIGRCVISIQIFYKKPISFLVEYLNLVLFVKLYRKESKCQLVEYQLFNTNN